SDSAAPWSVAQYSLRRLKLSKAFLELAPLIEARDHPSAFVKLQSSQPLLTTLLLVPDAPLPWLWLIATPQYFSTAAPVRVGWTSQLKPALKTLVELEAAGGAGLFIQAIDPRTRHPGFEYAPERPAQPLESCATRTRFEHRATRLRAPSVIAALLVRRPLGRVSASRQRREDRRVWAPALLAARTSSAFAA